MKPIVWNQLWLHSQYIPWYILLYSTSHIFMSFIHLIHPPYLGESISSETSNGYLNEAEVTWQAFDEEADTQSTQSAHMDVTTDPQGQGSLLLSHNEALAGIGTNENSPCAPGCWP